MAEQFKELIEDLCVLAKKETKSLKTHKKKAKLVNQKKHLEKRDKRYHDKWCKDKISGHDDWLCDPKPVINVSLISPVDWYNTLTSEERYYWFRPEELFVDWCSGNISREKYDYIYFKFKRIKAKKRLNNYKKQVRSINTETKLWKNAVVNKYVGLREPLGNTFKNPTTSRFYKIKDTFNKKPVLGDSKLSQLNKDYYVSLYYKYIGGNYKFIDSVVPKLIDIEAGLRKKPKGLIKGANFKRLLSDQDYPKIIKK